MTRLTRTILITLFVVFATRASHAQTTWHVDDDCAPPGVGTEADPFCTIQQGVDTASNGDKVLVHPGTYTGNGNRDISLFGKEITLTSIAGPEATTIDIQGGPSSIHRGFFLIHGETFRTVIAGFTITNGYLIGDTGGSGDLGGGGGAGIYLRDSSPRIQDCIIRDNVSATLHVLFVRDGRGAGIYADGDCDAVIENCVLSGNSSEKRGGAMYLGYENSSVTVRQCLITDNAGLLGGGIHHTFGTATIANNVIVNNWANGGRGIKNEDGEPFVTNCILWGNTATAGEQILIQGSVMTIEYSNVQGGLDGVGATPGAEIIWGTGMIDADPLFVDPEKARFQLLPGSPCIDAADSYAVPGNLVGDLDGLARSVDDLDTPDTGIPAWGLGVVDMGPYEFGGEDCNNNGILDTEDIAKETSADCDANNIPDECEPDCNNTAQADLCDIADGTSTDCDLNGRPDECQIEIGSPVPGGPFFCDPAVFVCDPDCNANGIPDFCDIDGPLDDDCNNNTIPDDCEPDCNANGQADECDLADGTSDDCNFNGIPDECEITIPILQQPQDQGAEPGEMAFFGVGVDAFLPAYQWRKDGVDLQDDGRIIGSQLALVIILEVIPEDAGEYDCFITDLITGCENTSDSATLTVHGPCPADFDGNGAVGPFDLAILLGNWGPNPNHPADLNDDDIIDATDLALLLGNWGPCE